MWDLWRDRALDLLLPRTCAGCRADLPAPMSGPLCGPCLRRLAPLEGPLCRRCAAPCREEDGICPGCRGGIFAADMIRSAFAYKVPVPQLLYAFKYGGRLSVGKALGDWMAGLFPRWPELAEAEAVAPVPLHPKRLRERGFNQAAILAGAVARAAGLPIIDALERARSTQAQWRLGRRERAENLKDAFRAKAGAHCPASMLLVDDVCTSGGTIEGCARALQEAGVREVRAYVLARD